VPDKLPSRKCPKKLEHVVINRGELNENILNVIKLSYKSLKTVDLSAVTNTKLADEAVKNFYNLSELKLPNNTEYIGYMSVAECVKLQSIDIPASVKEIEDRAFENCRNLKTINFGENPSLIRIGNWAFYNCHELQNLEIPEGVTEIGDGAFYGCTYLKNLNLPASVHSIGDNGFAFCSKLQKMVVHAVTPPDIDYKTFEEVSRQTPVYVPDESVDEYENHPLWKEFFIQGISNIPQGLDNTPFPSGEGWGEARKVLHNGQIFILRGEKVYTITGQETK
jgi:hypothetical protein